MIDGQARRGMAWLGMARLGPARHGVAGVAGHGTSGLGPAWFGWARRGRLGAARFGAARRVSARRGMAGVNGDSSAEERHHQPGPDPGLSDFERAVAQALAVVNGPAPPDELQSRRGTRTSGWGVGASPEPNPRPGLTQSRKPAAPRKVRPRAPDRTTPDPIH